MGSRLTITDLTRMQGTRICIAGVLPSGECIRPVLPRRSWTQSWLLRQRPWVLKPFAVVEMELIRPVPDLVPPHTEDWVVEPVYSLCGELTPIDRYELLHTLTCSHVGSAFGVPPRREEGGHGCWIPQGEGIRSLGTIHLRRVERVIFELGHQGKGVYRMQFEDEAGELYQLPVTDLAFRMCLDALLSQDGLSPAEAADDLYQRLITVSDVFLRLGLARGWERHPDRCYLQVNGVYSFPDYLDGRCFADFIVAPPPVEVPF